jgi:hypothetical protein
MVARPGVDPHESDLNIRNNKGKNIGNTIYIYIDKITFFSLSLSPPSPSPKTLVIGLQN